MNLELTDKVVVVTGASRGIGRAIALGMASEGARVVAVARDKAALDKLAGEARDRSKREAVAIGDQRSSGQVLGIGIDGETEQHELDHRNADNHAEGQPVTLELHELFGHDAEPARDREKRVHH